MRLGMLSFFVLVALPAICLAGFLALCPDSVQAAESAYKPVGTDMMCGPHCLWLAAEACGVRVSLNRVAQLAGTTPEDGTGVQGILDAASQLGLTGQVVETTPTALARDPRRAILILDGNTHFAYVKQTSSAGVVLIENLDVHEMSRSALLKRWDGLAIMLAPRGQALPQRAHYPAIWNVIMWIGLALILLGIGAVVRTARLRRRDNIPLRP